MKRKRVVLLTFALVVLAGGVAYRRLTSAPPAVEATDPPPPAEKAQDDLPEERARLQPVGTFQDDYKGKRTMTLSRTAPASCTWNSAARRRFAWAPSCGST
jgi:hypothetical protein